jgi:hypothetical protein
MMMVAVAGPVIVWTLAVVALLMAVMRPGR